MDFDDGTSTTEEDYVAPQSDQDMEKYCREACREWLSNYGTNLFALEYQLQLRKEERKKLLDQKKAILNASVIDITNK